jgi:hypothetical protein
MAPGNAGAGGGVHDVEIANPEVDVVIRFQVIFPAAPAPAFVTNISRSVLSRFGISETVVWARNDCAVKGMVDAVTVGVGVAGDGFIELVFATAFGALVIVVVAATVDVAVVVAVIGNGGNLTSGNKFGITFAVPAGVGMVELETVEVAVDVASVVVVNTGNGTIALSMIALCGGNAMEDDEVVIAVGAVAGAEVCTWHTSPE